MYHPGHGTEIAISSMKEQVAFLWPCGRLLSYPLRPWLTGSRFTRWYTTGKFSDFQIHCRGRVFDVHKVVLYNECTFFARLFDRAWKETYEGFINVDSDDPEDIDKLLRYLYHLARDFPFGGADMVRLDYLVRLNVVGDKYQAVDLLKQTGPIIRHTIRLRARAMEDDFAEALRILYNDDSDSTGCDAVKTIFMEVLMEENILPQLLNNADFMSVYEELGLLAADVTKHLLAIVTTAKERIAFIEDKIKHQRLWCCATCRYDFVSVKTSRPKRCPVCRDGISFLTAGPV